MDTSILSNTTAEPQVEPFLGATAFFVVVAFAVVAFKVVAALDVVIG